MLKNILLITVFAYGIFLVGANRVSVSPIDGFIRASMARNIVETGSLFPPIFPTKPMVDHPPLYIWSIAASYKIFGVSDFAAVFPGRLFGFLCVFATFWLGMLLGLPQRAALLGALVFIMTRDFVLITVQGGIEPLFTLTSLLAVCFILYEKKRPLLFSFLSGFFIVATAFSKGPPALWPALFIPFLITLKRNDLGKKLTGYLGGVILFSALWALWIKTSGLGWYWSWYWNEQVIGSGIKGRGQQGVDLLYFTKILLKDYWPWVPILLFAIYNTLKNFISKKELSNPDMILFIFSIGFFVGFSVVSFKFWYYIAPCFPAFALLCGNQIYKWALKKIKYFKVFVQDRWQKYLAIVSVVWILIASLFPIQLSSHRPKEVHDFKSILNTSPVGGPVWFVDHKGDDNMFKVSGYWYFHREIIWVNDESSKLELKKALQKPAWIVTNTENVNHCSQNWCKNIHGRWDSQNSTLILTP